jgi:transcriptional regulator with XRE-family HTH domain
VPTPSTTQLGAAIRHQRMSRTLSIESLAAAAGIHWTYLSRIERGLANPTWNVVTALVDELAIDIEDLIRMARTISA